MIRDTNIVLARFNHVIIEDARFLPKNIEQRDSILVFEVVVDSIRYVSLPIKRSGSDYILFRVKVLNSNELQLVINLNYPRTTD